MNVSSNPKPVVVLGFYGSTLDRGRGPRRWEAWRPTVALAQRDDLAIARLDLLVAPQHREGAEVVADDVRGLSPGTEVVLHDFPLGDPWDLGEVYEALLDFARRYPFDPDAEDYRVHLTTGTHIAQICWFLLVEAGFVPGRLLQAAPPRRDEPEGRLDVIDLDLARYDRIAQRFAREREAATGLLKAGIPTRNAAFDALIDRVERVVLASTAPVLLTGPTGAGKTALARRVYQLKRERRQLQGPLVEVNCATLRGDQAMAALFGHRRGAFTGAVADRDGLLKAAHGGLLFLDEIGDLGRDEQAMLLRAVEEKRFLPVGADREVESDFQLVAGTHRDLRAAVAAGTFRDDLLARIDVWTFALPALADRREDLEPNVDHELEAHTRRTGRRVTFNQEARAAFLAFARSPEAPWTGNFRDLNAAVTRMATLAPDGRIGVAEVQEEIARLKRSWAGPTPRDVVHDVLGDAPIDRFDRAQLAEVLRVCAASRTLAEAGRALFAVSRAERASVNDGDRLRKYLARFDLTFEGVRAALQGAS